MEWFAYLLSLLPLLSVLINLFQLYRLYTKFKRLLRQIQLRYPSLVGYATAYPVEFFTHHHLLQGANIAAVQRPSGYLFVAGAKVSLIAPAIGDTWIVHDFTPHTTHLTRVANPGLIFKGPVYLRFATSHERLLVSPAAVFAFRRHRAANQLYQQLSQTFPTEPAITPPHDSRRSPLAVLGLWGASMVALVMLVIFHQNRPLPLRHLAVFEDQSVLLAGDAHLLHLSPDGATLHAEKELAEAGVSRVITDLQAGPPGTFWLGDRDSQSIKQCSLSPWQCRSLPSTAGAMPLFQGDFSFVVDRGSLRLLASDTERHRILELDLDGQLTRTVWLGPPLCFPRGLSLAETRLIVANTHYHQIQPLTLGAAPQPVDAWLTVQTGRAKTPCPQPTRFSWLDRFFSKPDSGESAEPFHLSTSGHVWPIIAKPDADGAWWVFNATRKLTRPDVLRFKTPTSTPIVMLYGSDHDAVALLPRAGDVLVGDQKKIAILRFDLSGNFLGEFGDNILQRVRDAYRQEVRRGGLILFGTLAAFLIVSVILILLLVQHARWQSQWLLKQVSPLQT